MISNCCNIWGTAPNLKDMSLHQLCHNSKTTKINKHHMPLDSLQQNSKVVQTVATLLSSLGDCPELHSHALLITQCISWSTQWHPTSQTTKLFGKTPFKKGFVNSWKLGTNELYRYVLIMNSKCISRRCPSPSHRDVQLRAAQLRAAQLRLQKQTPADQQPVLADLAEVRGGWASCIWRSCSRSRAPTRFSPTSCCVSPCLFNFKLKRQLPLDLSQANQSHGNLTV